MPLFCVIAHDGTDPEAPARRRAARAAHFERMKDAVEAGKIFFAGSMLAENDRMAASLVIADFPTQEALEAWLAEEPYVHNGAWQRLEAVPLFVAVRDGAITLQWLEMINTHRRGQLEGA